MRARFAFVAVLLFILQPVTAYSEKRDEIVLSETGSSDSGNVLIYPYETKELKASLLVHLEEKAWVEFSWTDPAGTTAGRTVKIAFPSKTSVSITDTINISDYPEKNKPGLWKVQVTINGRKLSSSFFLTKNRQLFAISGNDKERKLDALAHMGNNDPDALKILEVATSDPDGEVRLAALQVTRRLKPDIGKEVLKKAQLDPLPGIRAEAFQVLYSKDYGYPVEAAERASSDDSAEVRMVVGGSLVVKGAKESELMKRLLKDPSAGVVSAGLSSLMAQNGEAVTSVLLDAVSTGGKTLKKDALEVLYSKEGPGKLLAIEAGLRDPDPKIRKKAFEKALTSKEAGTATIRTLVNDPDLDIALNAIEALYVRRDVEGLLSGLRSGEKDVRLRSTAYLGKISGPEAVKGFESVVKDEYPEVRKAAVEGLRQAGEAGITGLGEAVADKDEALRAAALSGLAKYSTSKAREAVQKALKDPSPGVREAAVDYFTSFKDPAIAPVLVGVACDSELAIRTKALAWLSKTKGEESSKAICAFIPCGDAGMRRLAVEVLAARDDARSSGAIISALGDSDPGIRLLAASALLAKGVKAPVARLWSDQSPEIRRLSLLAMAAAPQPDMIDALKAITGDKDQIIRLLSLDVLKDIKGEEAGRIISSLATDEDAQVRDRARQILLDRSDEGAVDGLSLVLADGGTEERVKAVEALASIPGQKSDAAICKAFQTGGSELKASALRLLAARQASCLAEAVKDASSDPDAKLREAALGYFTKVPPALTDDVYTVFLSSSFAEVRLAGTRGLAGNGKYAGTLEKMLDDPVADIRRETLSALLKQKYPLAGRLRDLLHDSDSTIARTALELVLPLPDSSEKADMLLIVANGDHPELRVSATRGLVPLGDPRALSLFVKYYGEGYEPDEMLKGITEVKGPEAIEALSYAYHKGNEKRRVLVIKSLSGRGPAAVKLVLQAMDDQSRAVRSEALALSKDVDPVQRLDIVTKGLEDPDISIRLQSLDCLAGIDENLSMGFVVQSLNDPELVDKAFALLSGMNAPLVVRGISGVVSGLREPDVRRKAVSLLDEKGADSGAFIKLLDDSECGVRRTAVGALIKRGDPEAAYGLILAGIDRDANLARQASAALGKLNAEAVGGGIAMLFEKDMASRERLLFVASVVTDPEILKGLVGRIKDESDLGAVLGIMLQSPSKANVPAMVEGLRVNDATIRTGLVDVIASIGESPDILTAIYGKYPDQRPEVIDAASRNGKLSAVLPLGLKDQDPAIRRQAAAHIKEAPPSLMGGMVTAALSDPDEDVRVYAVAAACASGLEAPLLKAASDPSIRVKKASAAGISGLKSGKAPTVLEELARDASPEVSGEALRYLTGLGEVAPSSLWRGLLSDRSVSTAVRLSAVDTLSSRKDLQSIPLFTWALSGDTPEIKEAVIKGMPAFGKDALPAIYALLAEKERRAAALTLIKQMGDTAAEGPLLSALSRMDDAEFSSALEILGAVGSGKSVDALAGLYRHASIYRKNSIVKTLGYLKVNGDKPEVAAVISDALDSGSDSVRFHAAHASGSMKIKGLNGKLKERVDKEPSDLIKNELRAAMSAIERKD